MKTEAEKTAAALGAFGSAIVARRATLAGPVIFAIFCLAALWIWLPSGGTGVSAPETGSLDLSAKLTEHRTEIANLIPVTGERPLFQADRRPLAAPEAPAPPPEAVLVLVGILGDGGERVALVRPSDSQEIFQLEAGGQLGKWQITTVDVSSITVVETDGTTYSLRLDG